MSAERSNNFDAVRLTAALFVLCSHQFALSGRPEPMIAGPHSLGNVGVLVFFSISGFLIATSWTSDPNLPRFLLRRFLRMWPGLVVVVTLMAGLWTVTKRGVGVDFVGLLSPIWLSVKGSLGATLNGSLWTIPFEAACYAILCGAGLVFRQHLSKVWVLAIAAGLVSYVILMGGQRGFDAAVTKGSLSFLPYLGSFFAVGVTLHLFPRMLELWKWSFIAGALAFAVGQTLIGLLLCVPVASLKIGLSDWPFVRRAGRFGDLSYGIYLYAWPVQIAGVRFIGKESPYIVLLAVSFVATVGLAFLSWRFVERPTLTLKPKRPILRFQTQWS